MGRERGFLMMLVLLCLGPPLAQAGPVLRLLGPRPDTGGWPVGGAMGWVSKKAIAEIKADEGYPFDIEVDYFNDKCSRNYGMKQFIMKAYLIWLRIFYFPWGGSAPPDPPFSRLGGRRDSRIYSIRYNKNNLCITKAILQIQQE